MRVWVLSHLVTEHFSGGAANFYRLCHAINGAGYESYVPIGEKYPFSDRELVDKYWVKPKYFLDNIEEGDIVITPELWPEKVNVHKPIRRVKFIQNLILHAEGGWEKNFLIYGSRAHNELFKRLFKPKNVYEVRPYFNLRKFRPGINDPGKFIILPRKEQDIGYAIARRYGDRCIVADNMHEDEIAEAYRSVGFLAYTSAIEGLGYPVIEAFLSGCAVITWNCLGPADLAKHNFSALISPYKDLNKMCENIDLLINNKELQKNLARNGLELVLSNFSYDRTLFQVREAIEAIILDKPEL